MEPYIPPATSKLPFPRYKTLVKITCPHSVSKLTVRLPYRPTCCWPRRQKQYVRTHLLHELSNWGTWPDEQELYVVVLLFVELLKRRDEFAGVVGLPYLNEPLSLETLEQTVRAKLRVGPGVSGVYPDHRLCRSIFDMLDKQRERKRVLRERRASPAEAVAEAVVAQNTQPEDVELVMSQASCSRAIAVKALYANDCDIVDALIELTM